MKKTFIFGLIAAALGFTACSSEDDLNVNDNNQKKGMVLRATVEQPAESRATFTDNEGVWQFAFDNGDKVSVTNNDMTPDFYTFTNEGTEFKCEEAKAAEGPVTWHAYFPSNEVSLVGQSGAKEDVANLYALAGKSSATTGEEGLNITMSPKVAILVINNQIGTININVKNSATTWVSGLTANADGFDVTTSTTQQNLLSVTTKGTYYVAVPAGVQLAVKDGDKVIKSTNGLTAGKYYNLTIEKPVPEGSRGKAYANGPSCEVNWVQLWKDGPKWAEYNVGATSVTEYGDYYTWADNIATTQWGSKWRMPTSEELQALIDNCETSWTTVGGVNGRKFTGKGDYSSNSIFLPAAGFTFYGRSFLIGSDGKYWSSTPSENSTAQTLYISSGSKNLEKNDYSNGYSVRAVLAE